MTQILMGLNPLVLHAWTAKVAISSAIARLIVLFVKIPLMLLEMVSG